MVRVKYLGASKRNFAVRPNGNEYKWKPGMTHLEMTQTDAEALASERPDLWEVEAHAAIPLASSSGELPTVGELLSGDEPKRKRKSDEGG